ncbi:MULTISPECIES: acyl carrier protein [unclassified Gemella]|uniref:acyl carrier protein n=1 Tax=unclassified Gemella TaxID=2624949 RepID=UPI001C051354|nr:MULTISPECIES: acyl carrier protein [unclassified Gemella]MBU0278853.1 acyl carrier protein [Gemella sp. zg-1178]QWQ39400.1 acyl carrier protein [Gemella sp. zg-570]
MVIFEEVKEIILKHINIDSEDIKLDSNLNDDLDADSIEIAEIVMDIEEKYNFEFSDEDASNIEKISDLISHIEKNK